MIRVLIADDHSIVRKGLKQILLETPEMMVAGEAENGMGALKMLEKGKYDVVVLDISMPDLNGIEVLKAIRAKKNPIPVLILSMHPEDQYAIRVLKAGASGYMTKESAPDQLVAAIKMICSGKKYLTPYVAEKLASMIEDDDSKKAPHELLSNREFEVMCLIAKGKTCKEIGEVLCLSPKTIDTYRARLLDKMNLKNNSEVTRYAIENGIVG